MQQVSNQPGLTFSNTLATAIQAYAQIESIKRETNLVDQQIERDRLNLAALSQNQKQSFATPTYPKQVTNEPDPQNVQVAGFNVNKYLFGGSVALLGLGVVALLAKG